MSVGFSQLKADVDNRAGQLCLQLRDTLNNIGVFNAYLVALGQAALVADGYSSAEATAILANFSVLDQFRQVFLGAATIPSAVNVASFARPYVGVI